MSTNHHHSASSGGHAGSSQQSSQLSKLALAALGVVYGDIGTSPLYALKECVKPKEGQAYVNPTPENVLGLLSLFFWSLTLVVVSKYLTFIMRADNKGEGGILSLLALISPKGDVRGNKAIFIFLALFGASLLYGEGLITPAISVLSAVEGLDVATHTFEPVIIPITIVILIAVFLFQKRGTAGVGAVFGPAMLIWFSTLIIIGLPWIIKQPHVLHALNPVHAALFIINNGFLGFLVLGSVVLCITGCEALYADMGHFGRKPIRMAWYALVFPALIVNYFGQGAVLLNNCASATSQACIDARSNTFYALAQGWALYPVVLIATIAAIVASQALISGAFSLTQQATQLGFSPRVTIIHTSGEAEGQIYIPEVNNALMVACVALVLAFQKSDNLAAAYGIAVTGTMAITSVLFFQVARTRLGFSFPVALALMVSFLVMDLTFFAANVVKIKHGGWFPLVTATILFICMTTWKTGRALLGERMRQATMPLDLWLKDIENIKPHRVKGTAVFMTANPDVPPVLLHHFKHNKVLHEQVVFLSVSSKTEPEVPASERVNITEYGQGVWRVEAFYGFMQKPDVGEILRICSAQNLKTAEGDTSFFLGREVLLATGSSTLNRLRKALFVFMSRNAVTATAYFGIPPNRVVELGAQIEL